MKEVAERTSLGEVRAAYSLFIIKLPPGLPPDVVNRARRHQLENCRHALARRSPAEILELRDQFGPGNAGILAFTTIAVGNRCEVGKNGNGSGCVKEAVGTVDYDCPPFNDLELVTHCADHRDQALLQVRSMLEKDAPFKVGGMSRNGWGRG